MITLQLQVERKDGGIVQARLLEYDAQTEEPTVPVWECTVAQDTTRHAQKAALKATFDYLNSYIDLSEGGRFY